MSPTQLSCPNLTHQLPPPNPHPQKAYVALNWVLTDAHLDVETELALGFLDYLLLGTSAAPLRKVRLGGPAPSFCCSVLRGGGQPRRCTRRDKGARLSAVFGLFFNSLRALHCAAVQGMGSRSGFSSRRLLLFRASSSAAAPRIMERPQPTPSPQALNDSGLGAALIGGGIDDELKQPIFSVGLKVGGPGGCFLVFWGPLFALMPSGQDCSGSLMAASIAGGLSDMSRACSFREMQSQQPCETHASPRPPPSRASTPRARRRSSPWCWRSWRSWQRRVGLTGGEGGWPFGRGV
jgi:hypothetical protein